MRICASGGPGGAWGFVFPTSSRVMPVLLPHGPRAEWEGPGACPDRGQESFI